MNRKMKIIREVNNQAVDFYNDAVALGDHAAFALKKSHRSQMTSLENIAESTLKTTDVFDYLKKQIARYDYWQRPFREQRDASQGFGERLKSYLETNLSERITSVSNAVGIGNATDADKQERREIHLLLMRQFIRQVVVQYEYRVNLENAGREG
ncbi:MAG TPA: hypothetical protein VKT25_00215 [Ktedonobacteraceae bacterium]|nr:hypothetical protein [Ktedonobacteraceae bacterium]